MADEGRTVDEISVPAGVSVSLVGNALKVKGKKGELERVFEHPRVDIEVTKEKINVVTISKKKADRALVGTWRSHIRNMMKGVAEGYHYKMRIIFSHFPIKTSVKGDELVIENFVGERFPRKAHIVPGVTAKISGDTITLEGIDKEKVGQTAANIEKATVIRNFDPRVFQDGIYLTSRGDE